MWLSKQLSVPSIDIRTLAVHLNTPKYSRNSTISLQNVQQSALLILQYCQIILGISENINLNSLHIWQRRKLLSPPFTSANILHRPAAA